MGDCGAVPERSFSTNITKTPNDGISWEEWCRISQIEFQTVESMPMLNEGVVAACGGPTHYQDNMLGFTCSLLTVWQEHVVGTVTTLLIVYKQMRECASKLNSYLSS